QVRESRLALARPLKRIQDKLIDREREYLAPVQERLKRISGFVTAFQERERKRAAEEERKRQEEFARLEAERRQAEQEANKADDETQRLEAEMKAYEVDQAQHEMVMAGP